MLTAYPASRHEQESPAGREAQWVDLLDPTNEERASVESRYGIKLPSRPELSQVESSSRVSEENGVLFLSMPTISPAGALAQPPSPVGFVLSKSFLVSIRYTQLRSFDLVAAKLSKDVARGTSVETFAALVDEMVGLSADLLEEIGADLDTVSRAVFPRRAKRRRHVTRSNDALREILIDVGNAGERLSRIRDSL